MFAAGMTHTTLETCLLSLPPLELLGMKLLQDMPHAGLFPSDVPRETLRNAVIEMIEYGDCCQRLAEGLSKLTPVPLIGVDIVEFAL